MSLQSVYEKLVTLSNTPSSNAKIALLKEYIHDDLFYTVATYAYDSRLTFRIKKFPAYRKFSSTANDKLFNYLMTLNSQTGATQSDKNTLFALASTDEETYEVVRRICNGDLRCGCGKKVINKAIPKSIFHMPYMRCSSHKKMNKIVWPAIAQEKEDGLFAHLIINNMFNEAGFFTREGLPLTNLQELATNLTEDLPENSAYDGEVRVMRDGTLLSRKEGNGLVNSSVVWTDTLFPIYRCWDTLTLEEYEAGYSATPYDERWGEILELTILADTPTFQHVQYIIACDEKEVKEFYAEIRAAGGEGCVVKNYHGVWKDHTSPNSVKLKEIMDVELEITGWYYGDPTKKFAKCLGGLHCESKCGKLKVNVGGGFTEPQRGYKVDTQAVLDYWTSQIGSIAGLECNEPIQDEKTQQWSLFLPEFDAIRTDKHEAETLEEILSR